MRAVWAWRLMLLVAIPSLALVAMATFTQLPFALADPGNKDREGLIAWAVAVAAGVVALIASVGFRRAGKMTPAILLVAIVALPALAGIGIFALIVTLFILKGN
ncbi:hypothetical protein [Roseomonas sp. AR75]|uniref:hypothetical protein n=1 Tax=Roseomonas sp. AR75 TaxID=2562311 RepID=UPI0010BFF6B8|nr:hypothetical protein [Roseomonas sp. AR75]